MGSPGNTGCSCSSPGAEGLAVDGPRSPGCSAVEFAWGETASSHATSARTGAIRFWPRFLVKSRKRLCSTEPDGCIATPRQA